MMGDRRISRKRKGNMLSPCITPAYTNALETMALTEKQQKVQICKNNLIRRIVGVKRADKRRMYELRVEVGVKESFKKKLVRSRLTWAGHVERMGDEKLAKKADVQAVKGKMRRVRSKLRKEWENGEKEQHTGGTGGCW